MRALLISIVLGRLVIWVIQTNGLTRGLWKLHPILTELGECDFCLGVWVFTLLAWKMGVNFLEPDYLPFVSEFITGCTISLGVHLARIGWTARFTVMDLTD